MAVAADGAIWAAGRELVDGKEINPDHHVIRRFEKTGRMLGSSIARSSLNIAAQYTHPADYSFLVASRDRIGWYSEPSQQYIEFSSDGAVMNRFSTAEYDAKRAMHGVALCDDGSLFVSTEMSKPGGVKGWGISTLDRERGVWTFIPKSERWGMLYGCDGTTLAGRTSASAITWLEPVKSR